MGIINKIKDTEVLVSTVVAVTLDIDDGESEYYVTDHAGLTVLPHSVNVRYDKPMHHESHDFTNIRIRGYVVVDDRTTANYHIVSYHPHSLHTAPQWVRELVDEMRPRS